MKLRSLILIFNLLCSLAYGQTSGGGVFTNHPTQSICDIGSGTCYYPYKLNFTTGSIYSSGNGIVNITTNGSSLDGFWTGLGSNIYNNNPGNVGIGTQSITDILTVAGSSGGVTIDGIAAPNTATGGTQTTSGANTIATFTSSGTFTPAFNGTVNVLVVAGGGSGGMSASGGGGAGGVQTNTAYSVTSGTPITVTIGTGGAAVSGVGASGHAGLNSVFGTITANGGGAGSYNSTGGNGGSGGGGSGGSGGGTGSQGSNGGSGFNSGAFSTGGGGGGFGGNGTNGNTNTGVGGNGGAGYPSSISGSSVTYACGGGAEGDVTGGSAGCASAGTGGTTSSSGTSASANSGSGGGGSGVAPSGAGASGIVIVSFVTSPAATPILTLGTPGTTLSQIETNSSTKIQSFFNNSIDAMNIDSNGNVGIGTTTPVGALTIMNGNVGIGTWVPGVKLEVDTSSPEIRFNRASNHYWDIGMNSSNEPLSAFGIREEGASTWLTVLPSTGYVGIGTTTPVGGLTVMNGNVGIGTWVPAAPLDAIGTTSTTFRLERSGSGAINFGLSGQIAGDTTDLYVNPATSSSGFVFASLNGSGTGVNALAIDKNGNVGIGTVITANAGMSIMNGNVGIGTWVPDGALIVKSGNVGIGSVTANFTLDIQPETTNMRVGAAQIGAWPGNTAYAYFGTDNLSQSNTTNYAVLQSVSGQTYLNASSGNTMNFRIANVDKMLLDSNGNVGIGTTTPSGLLEVGAQKFDVLTGGNVGIGSITPGAALDVQGTVRGISAGTCTTLYRCQGGVDAGVIQTSACVLCPASTCVAMNGCF